MKIILTLTLALFLSACANLSPTGKPEPTGTVQSRWEDHQETLSSITAWQLDARVAVKAGTEGGTVNLYWNERAKNNYQLELHGALGQGRTKIISTPEKVRLLTPEGPEWIASNAEDLLAEYTGWYLPIDNLYYWVRGLPAPESATTPKLNSAGRIERLVQDGWTVTYQEYMQVQGIWLPKRFTLEYPGDANHPAVNVKWLNKEWVF